MAAKPWEFWIDVGGTFTDCLAKSADGAIRQHKLLSSGVTKGRIGSGSSPHVVIDSSRRNDPPGFWVGWQLAIVGEDGGELDRAAVTAFDAATARLEVRELAVPPPIGAT